MNCSDCSAPISKQNKTGRCRRCAASRLASDPAHIARRTETMRRRLKEDTAFRQKKAREIHCRHMAARRDPVKSARLNATITRNRRHLDRPGVREKWLAGRAEAGRKRHETVMAWCPPEYRQEYRYLRLTKKLLAAEAKRVILAKLTPFERQMQAVRNGARLVSAIPRPSRDYDYTLAGVSQIA